METDRLLLNIRTIDVSYRSALRHAPQSGAAQVEWLAAARLRADQLLNALESRAIRAGAVDPRVALGFRVVRERIRHADEVARSHGAGGEATDPTTP